MQPVTDTDAIKARFIAARGYWRPWTEALLRANPDFLARYADYAGYPAQTGPLTPRMVELLYIALDASATHLHEAGLATHMRLARQAGASDADIFDVLHLVTLQGVSAVLQAADLLHAAAPPSCPDIPRALRARIGKLRPEQAASLLRLAALDPGYVAVLLDFAEQGAPANGLSHAERLLVRLALHACFTHGDMAATRTLIAEGLALGANRAELLQAIQLGAHLAIHGAALGATVHAGLAGAAGAGSAQAVGG